MTFIAALATAVALWLISVVAYTIIGAVWLDWIGQFGLSFRELVGIAGILAAVNTTVTTSTR